MSLKRSHVALMVAASIGGLGACGESSGPEENPLVGSWRVLDRSFIAQSGSGQRHPFNDFTVVTKVVHLGSDGTYIDSLLYFGGWVSPGSGTWSFRGTTLRRHLLLGEAIHADTAVQVTLERDLLEGVSPEIRDFCPESTPPCAPVRYVMRWQRT